MTATGDPLEQTVSVRLSSTCKRAKTASDVDIKTFRNRDRETVLQAELWHPEASLQSKLDVATQLYCCEQGL